MSEVKTLATLVLGGAFDATELGDNEIYPDMSLIEVLQQELVTGFDDVSIELVSRTAYDAVQSELAALREELEITKNGDLKYRALLEQEGEIKTLQQRLADAEQRNVELEAELGPTFAQIRASNKAVAAQLKQGEGRCKFDVLWRSGGSAVDATITEDQYSQILKILHPEASGVSDAFHAALKPIESGASE